MNGQLDNLDCSIITGLDAGIDRERDLRKADSAGIGVLGGTDDTELGYHGVRHVGWAAVGAIGAEAKVDKDLSRGMALEPTGLERNSTTGHGPESTVGRCLHTTA